MLTSLPTSTWVIGALVFFRVLSAGVSGNEPPIQGDPKLLMMIRDAQHANSDRYPFGEAEVAVETGRRGEPARHRREALVRWDGDDLRLTGTSIERGLRPGEAGPRVDRHPFDQIYHDGRSISYMPGQRVMTISRISTYGHYSLTRLRPQDWWYGKVDGEGPSWAENLDGMLRRPPEYLAKFRAVRLPDEQIEVTRDDGLYRSVSSLKDEGNMVLSESLDTEHDASVKHTYAWSHDPRGRCYLRSCRVERYRPQRGGGLWWNLEVVRFDPDRRPPRSTFDDRAIRLPPGTVVDDQIAGKRRRVGDRSTADTSPSLDGLVPELKSRGFAAPARER